jgi:hypothetical protein
VSVIDLATKRVVERAFTESSVGARSFDRDPTTSRDRAQVLVFGQKRAARRPKHRPGRE